MWTLRWPVRRHWHPWLHQSALLLRVFRQKHTVLWTRPESEVTAVAARPLWQLEASVLHPNFSRLSFPHLALDPKERMSSEYQLTELQIMNSASVVERSFLRCDDEKDNIAGGGQPNQNPSTAARALSQLCHTDTLLFAVDELFIAFEAAQTCASDSVSASLEAMLLRHAQVLSAVEGLEKELALSSDAVKDDEVTVACVYPILRLLIVDCGMLTSPYPNVDMAFQRWAALPSVRHHEALIVRTLSRVESEWGMSCFAHHHLLRSVQHLIREQKAFVSTSVVGVGGRPMPTRGSEALGSKGALKAHVHRGRIGFEASSSTSKRRV
jgi:hypothetical protein